MINNKQFTIYKWIGLLLFIVYCLLFTGTEVFAQEGKCVRSEGSTEYCLLEPDIPYIDKGGGKADAATFLVGLFKLLIGLAGVMAVIMIIYGGVIKMSSDAVSGQSKANEIISNAIWGLIFAIAAWLILYTINPRLVEIKFDIEPQQVATSTLPSAPGLRPGETAPTPGPGAAMTPEQIAADKAVRTTLESKGVGINAGPCTQGQTSGCTNLNGLHVRAIDGLITLKSDCKCVVRVTGGTEAGHQTHRVGEPIVDLGNESSLRSWMTTKGFLKNNSAIAEITLSNGRKARLVFEKAGQGRSTGDHWHVVF